MATSERVDRFLEAVFRIRPGEAATTLLMFGQCFAAVGAFIVGRSVRDALFLSRVDKATLPWVYVASAVAVALASYTYSRFLDRTRRDVLTAVTTLLLGGTVLGLRGLVTLAEGPYADVATALYTVVYVWVEVFGAISVLTFWSFANEVWNSREAKRLFGFIGAGGTVANILVGMAVSVLSKALGAANLFYVCAGLLFLSAGVGWLASTRVKGRFARVKVAAPRSGKQAIRMRQETSRVFHSPHLRTVAALVALTFVVTTLVDFQFKVIAKSTWQEAELAAFFGRFYAAAGVASLVIQFFVTGRLLERFGIIASLAVLPLGLFVGSAGLAFMPGIVAASVAKGADNVFRYTVNDATMQLLYLPISSASRGRAKAFIDGILKPGAIAFAGVLLAGYTALTRDAGPLAWISLTLLVGWGGLLFGLRTQYLDSLRDTLRRRKLDLENARYAIADESTAIVLRRSLQSGEVREIRSAIELLPHVPSDFDGDVAPLLTHKDANVRRDALGHLARRGSLRFGGQILGRFEDEDPEVRAAAIRAFCAIGREKSIRTVARFLWADQPAVQAATIGGMIRFGGLDGVLAAGEALKRLLASDEPERRATAAQVLGEIGVRNFYQPLVELLGDTELPVRRAAIRAAGQLKSPELVPALVYQLGSDETALDATAALTEYGPTVLGTLSKVLGNPREDASVRRHVPRVLGHFTEPQAVAALQAQLTDPDEELRRRIYKALVRILRRRPELKVDKRTVGAALQLELQKAWRALAAAEALQLSASTKPPREATPGPEGAAYLLGSALTEKVQATVKRCLMLLQVLYPAADLEIAETGLADENPTRRANALELLDNVLDGPIKRQLVPLLEDGPRGMRLRAASDWLELPAQDAEGWVAELLADESPWVVACTIAWAGRAGLVRAADGIEALLGSTEPFVREAAVVALEGLVVPDRLLSILDGLRDDPSPVVGRHVTRILAPLASSS